MTTRLEVLLAAAVKAPSGDNLQPWRFEVDQKSGRIALHVDPTRDPSPMNARQLMSRVAVGAALENMIRTAEYNGWCARLDDPSPPAIAAIRLEEANEGAGVVEENLISRSTNRRPYEGRSVPVEIIERLRRDMPELDGVRTHWITERGRIDTLAALIGRADAFMFTEPSMRRAFLGNVRFDAASKAEVEFGLPTAALELSFFEILSLRLLLPWLSRRMFQWTVAPLFAWRSEQLVKSASGLCVGCAPDYSEAAYLAVGRAMQRAWLALTTAGLAVQPMMSLVVLDHLGHHGDPELLASLRRKSLADLGTDFRNLAPEIAEGRPAFLLRFGHAPPPSGRTGRLPWRASQYESSTPQPVESL